MIMKFQKDGICKRRREKKVQTWLVLVTVMEYFFNSLLTDSKTNTVTLTCLHKFGLQQPSWFWRGLLLSLGQKHIPMAKLETLKCECNCKHRGAFQEQPESHSGGPNTFWAAEWAPRGRHPPHRSQCTSDSENTSTARSVSVLPTSLNCSEFLVEIINVHQK